MGDDGIHGKERPSHTGTQARNRSVSGLDSNDDGGYCALPQACNFPTPYRLGNACALHRSFGGKAFVIATHQNNPGTHPTVSPKPHLSTGHPASPRSAHCTYDNDKSCRHFPRNRMKEFPYARSLKTSAAPIFRLQTLSVASTVQTTSRRIQTDSSLIPLDKVLPRRLAEPVHHALPRIGTGT